MRFLPISYSPKQRGFLIDAWFPSSLSALRGCGLFLGVSCGASRVLRLLRSAVLGVG